MRKKPIAVMVNPKLVNAMLACGFAITTASVSLAQPAPQQGELAGGNRPPFNRPPLNAPGDTASAAPTAPEVKADAADTAASQGGSATEINVKNAEIASVLRIFSKKTKRNYILDERVKGKVSIYLPGKISSDEAIRILDAVLQLKGFTAVPIGDNLWKILPSREARQTTIPTVEESEGWGSPSMVTKLVQLKYVSADDIKQLLSPLVSSNGMLNAYTGTNSLIIIDAEENIVRLERLIETLDVAYQDQEMAIIPVKNAEATDLAEKITQILSEGDDSGSAGGAAGGAANRLARAANRIPPTPDGSGGIPGSPGGEADSVTVGARARATKLIADERTNSLIVVADDETVLRIKALVDQLDSPLDLSGNRFYVYRCQHANAEEIATVLGGLVGGGGASGSTTGASTGGGFTSAAGGLGGANNNQGGFGFNDQDSSTFGQSSSFGSRQRSNSRQDRQRRQPGQSRNNGGQGGGVTSVNFGEDVSITADPSTNSLIINAGKTDYLKIKDLLKKLDVKRRQVLVEALILEVNVTDQKSTSFEFLSSGGGSDGGIFAANNLGNLTNLLSNPAQLSNFSVAAASAGSLSLPGGITIPTQTALIRAAQQNGNVNILSSPNILATDNEEAEIVVGQNVPFIASTATNNTNLNNTFNQIDRQDVGITLRLTPQISSRDFVTLRMFTEVSDVVAGTDTSQLGPTTTVRTSETTVITKNNQMIVMGGLMGDNQQSAEDGVPFLKDIPLLGTVFKSRTDRALRTNLLIFITPRIVSDQYDARDTSLNYRDTMREHIDEGRLAPDREEVLNSERLDNVILSHVEDFKGKKPTTIRSANSRSKSGEAELEQAMATGGQGQHGRGSFSDSSAVPAPGSFRAASPKTPLSFSVAPKVPSSDQISAKQGQTSDDPEVLPPMVSRKNSTLAESSVPLNSRSDSRNTISRTQSSSRFVVMKASGSNTSGLPFAVNNQGIVLVEVPEGASTAALGFFEPGEQYSYHSGDNSVALRALGSFKSRSEAEAFYSVPGGNWVTLSPYEVLHIGSKPWVRGTR